MQQNDALVSLNTVSYTHLDVYKRQGLFMYFDNMVLYYKLTCPFCHRVLAFMEEEDIAMPMRDTLEPGVKDDLVRIAGKGQVPCLVVDGVPMFESDDIIRFLGDLILEREED